MSGKVVLITGATSCIGKEAAILLASKGWKVIVSGRREAEGQKVVDEIRRNQGKAVFIASDISSEESVDALHKSAIETYGRIDAAVNNAGCSLDSKPLMESSTSNFEKMIQVNVLGVYWCMKAQIEHMLDIGGGSIVNLASIADLHGILFSGPYCATKHAVVGLTKTAALEYSTQGINVNAVAPGAIKTDILNQAIEDGAYSEESIAAIFPSKRMGVPMDIARAIEFLLASPYSHGSIVQVDGGYGAR